VFSFNCNLGFLFFITFSLFVHHFLQKKIIKSVLVWTYSWQVHFVHTQTRTRGRSRS